LLLLRVTTSLAGMTRGNVGEEAEQRQARQALTDRIEQDDAIIASGAETGSG